MSAPDMLRPAEAEFAVAEMLDRVVVRVTQFDDERGDGFVEKVAYVEEVTNAGNSDDSGPRVVHQMKEP